MLTRRTFLQGCTSLAASAMVCARAGAVNGEPIRTIQNRIDRLCRRALNERDARAAIVVGVVTPDTGSSGQLLFAGRDTLVNPFGDKLVLDARTPFAIGSTSKVFTSGIHYMLHGPYEGRLGTWLGSRMTMSTGVADLQLRNLAIYEPGLAQDNKGGVYPPDMMRSLRNLFDYMAHFVPPYEQGACYAYSNIGWALLSMASLRLNSLDTEAFVTEYDQRLKQFCSRFDASDTSVFHPDMKPRLPIGYNRRLEPLPAGTPYRPSFPPGYGSGGIVSTGADMLRYLLYNMGRLPGRTLGSAGPTALIASGEANGLAGPRDDILQRPIGVVRIERQILGTIALGLEPRRAIDKDRARPADFRSERRARQCSEMRLIVRRVTITSDPL